MTVGLLKKRFFTSDQIYWTLECCPDKVGVSEANNEKIMNSEGFISVEDLDEAKKDFPFIDLNFHDHTDLQECQDFQKNTYHWFLKWFGEPEK